MRDSDHLRWFSDHADIVAMIFLNGRYRLLNFSNSCLSVGLLLLVMMASTVAGLCACSYAQDQSDFAISAVPNVACNDPESAETFVVSFFKSLNDQDITTALAHIGTDPGTFEFFFDSGYQDRTGSSGNAEQNFGLEYLRPQIASIVSRKESFELSSFSYGLQEIYSSLGAARIGHFYYTGIRSSSDGATALLGKGALQCGEQRIIALTIGDRRAAS